MAGDSTAKISFIADTRDAERALGNLNNSIKNLATAFGVALSISQFAKIADDMTGLNNRLKAVTKSTDDYAYAQMAVQKIAQDTRTPLTDVADIYSRLSLALTDYGYTQKTVADVSTTFIQQVKMSGASMVEQSSAILQFGQAMTKGVLRWDDLKPLMTAAPGYVMALQKALGMTSTEFMFAAQNGKLTTEVLVNASRKMADETAANFAKMGMKFSDAITLLTNHFSLLVNKINNAFGMSQTFGETVQWLTKHTAVLTGTFVGMGAAAVYAAYALSAAFAAVRISLITTGVGALIVGLGALTGLAIEYSGVLDEHRQKEKDKLDAMEKQMSAAQKAEEIAKRRTMEQMTIAKAIDDELNKMISEAKIEADRYQIGIMEYEIRKKIADEQEKMAKENGSLIPREIEKIRLAVMQSQLAKEKAQVDKQIIDIQSQMITNAIVDVDQQSIAVEMEKLRLSVSDQTYRKRKDDLQTILEQNQALQLQTTYARMTAPEAPTQVASRASNILGGTQEGLAVEYQRQQVALDALKQRGLINDQTYADQQVLIERSKADAIIALDQKVMEARMKNAGVLNDTITKSVTEQMANIKLASQGGISGLQGVLGIMDNVASSMGTFNKTAFENHKKLATVMAVISTYQAVATTMATIPWPMNLFAAAGALAAGMAQVAAIQSQTYSGRALGGPVMGNTSYIVGERGPELFTPSTSGSITRNDQMNNSKPVNVNFTIVANDTTGFDSLLNSRKGMIKQLISDAMLEKGQRF